jgi:hypothetical protein
VTVIIFLGPILSFNLPTKIPRSPMSKKEREAAPEIVALDHPNSDTNDLKKTP